MNRKEYIILELISKGHTTREISQQLFLSMETIKTYRAHMLEKLGARNAAQLVYKAVCGGYLQSSIN